MKRAVDVLKGSKRRPKRAEVAPGRLLSARDRATKGAKAFTFEGVSRSEWERIFGSEAERQAKFRARLAQQKAERQARVDEVEAEGRAAAVHGENKGAGRRLYGSPHRGGFDWGLGRVVHGRNDRARAMRELGLREAN